MSGELAQYVVSCEVDKQSEHVRERWGGGGGGGGGVGHPDTLTKGSVIVYIPI